MMSIQRLSCFFNLCSSCSSRSTKRRRDCLLPPLAAGYAAAQASRPHRTPIAGLAIPLLTHTCCYSLATADEPVNPCTPPCGKQLLSIPWLRVVPFLGLAVVHHPGALGAAWSTWSMNNIHRKWPAVMPRRLPRPTLLPPLAWPHAINSLLITRKNDSSH